MNDYYVGVNALADDLYSEKAAEVGSRAVMEDESNSLTMVVYCYCTCD